MQEDCTDPSVEKVVVHDVEEGEISDSGSVEEITEEAFNTNHGPAAAVASPPPAAALKSVINSNGTNVGNNNNGVAGSGARVWTMRDLYKYQIAPNTSYSGLYNLAWAQAVNNKPLDEVFVMMEDDKNGNNDANGVTSNGDGNQIVIDVEDEGDKEEGELEEGEIDLDSEFNAETEGSDVLVKEDTVGSHGNDSDQLERSKDIESIKEELENLNVADAFKSFDQLSSSLETSVDKLHKMVLEGSLVEKDTLVQLLLAAVQRLHKVLSSMTPGLEEQNKDILLRLLAKITNLKPSLFSVLQLKEVEEIQASLELPATSLGINCNNKRKLEDEGLDATEFHVLPGNSNNVMPHPKKSGVAYVASGLIDQSEDNVSLQNSMSWIHNSWQKGPAPLLLDLHKDHDADSLPSPTRDHSAPLPFDKEVILERGLLKPEWPIPQKTNEIPQKTQKTNEIPQKTNERDNRVLHPYATDAVKAVSSYQQKFGWSSFSMNDKLPSPTPSEDGDASRDVEVNEEVSSSANHKVNRVHNTSTLELPITTSTASTALAGPDKNPRLVGSANSFQNPVLKSSAKRRDPRLRLANSDPRAKPISPGLLSVGNNESKLGPLGVSSLQKQSTVDELALDGPALKRQRNELSGPPTTLPVVSATSQMTNPTAVQSFTSLTTTPVTSEKLPVINANATTSLNSLLRNIVVNPSIWMNILKTENKISADDIKSVAHVPGMNTVPGVIPSNTAKPPLSSASGDTSAGIVRASSQEESGKVRMKPRDPRRVLHGNANTPQAAVSLGSNQTNKISSFSLDNVNNPRQEDRAGKSSVLSSGMKPPDIAMQFTSSLRNIADILSVSQASTSPPVPLQNPSSQQVHDPLAAKETNGVVADFDNMRRRSGLTSDAAIAACQTPNADAWTDVEHLFEGFDDQQKAAIQRERTRRLEEQKKMFAARKLSLVLDLDHTLLNSAKFAEIEPEYEEILRRKEELDRGQPQRHLFRFPHMGMWTKLRPGIWNFLEKASKLFELHLYTMGNKYYATEMAKLIDPKGELFCGRVISRGDDGEPFDGDDRVPKTKDLEGVLGMESSVLIIDDSVRVWPHNKLNLIVVERYIYFPCSRRQFGMPGPCLLEVDLDERPEDGTMASILAVIQRVHHDFFAQELLDKADVRNLLANEQRKILAGCRILFSRMFPVGEANPQMHPLWKTAEQFGAVCCTQIDNQVTHVVASSLGTDKVNWAMSTGRFAVSTGWVEASALLYRRVNELNFPVPTHPQPQPQPHPQLQ